MTNYPKSCPACGNTLSISRYECPQCGTVVTGSFSGSTGKLDGLSPEQAAFVLTFIRCEGKINRMEIEMGISYPTIRSRLEAIIQVLSDKDHPLEFSARSNRLGVLARLAEGEVTLEEALKNLKGV